MAVRELDFETYPEEWTQGAGCLVVSAHRVHARWLARQLSPLMPVYLATSGRQAEAIVRDRSITAIFIDGMLTDLSALDVLENLRLIRTGIPAMVLDEEGHWQRANRAAALDALYACWPLDESHILPFARRAIQQKGEGITRFRALVHRIADEHHLSDRDRELLACALIGLKRVRIAKFKKLSENTIKWRIRKLLDRIGAASFDQLRMQVLAAQFVADPNSDMTVLWNQYVAAG
jgi:DNA-binding NarL/FixJ family response regulator